MRFLDQYGIQQASGWKCTLYLSILNLPLKLQQTFAADDNFKFYRFFKNNK